MITVHKAPLSVHGRQEIEVPNGATLLTVQVQRGVPCIWYHCDDRNPMVRVPIVICGPGHEAPPLTTARYVGTFQIANTLVFHVFEEEPRRG